MGLSGRRRAKKETRTQKTTCAPDSNSADSRQQVLASHPRSGNTYRRVCPSSARDRKHTNMLEFQLKRGWRDDLLPPKQPTHPEIGAVPNANLYSRDMLHIMDNNYTSNITYSLNKQKRWRFTSQLLDTYQENEELKAHNIFLVESAARGSNGGATKRVVTNACYTMEAAAELREHKKKLHAKSASRPKRGERVAEDRRLVEERDRFEFSERVKRGQTERPLTNFSSASRNVSINYKSIRRSCNLWNNLYNVSPRVEEVRLEMQSDYDGRMEVIVGTCVPCPGVDVKRCRQVEKEIRTLHTETSKEPHMTRKYVNHMLRVDKRCEMALQLDMDGSTEVVLEDAAEGDDAEHVNSHFRRSAVTLFDAMMPTDDAVSVNREKKLAMKSRRMKKANALLHKKVRNESNQTDVSSGYDSGSESHHLEDRAQEAKENETEAVNARLVEAVDAALAVERQSVRVAREASDAARLVSMFADSGAEQALVIGNSLPRKLAIILQPDLSETVVFEEAVAQENPAFVVFAVHHVCNDEQTPRTSVEEVMSQADPFAYLCSLVWPRTAQRALQTEKMRRSGSSATSWKCVEVLPESDARLTAIQALPMFSVYAGDVDKEVELISSAECEICCQQLDTELRISTSFAEGSTMLIQCGHSFCNRCWLQHVASRVAQGRVDITCPGFKCQETLDAATLLWFCPSALLPALSAAAFRAWLSDRRQGRQRRLCPRRNCGVLECSVGVNAKCGVCSDILCLGCGQEPHWPINCATAARYRTKMQRLGHMKLCLHDLTSQVDVSAKQCPTCKLIIEKGVGCNHMTCPCGENFCWWCGEPMRTHNSGPCYSGSSSGRGRSEFHVQRVFTAADSLLVPSSSLSKIYCEAVKIRLHRESLGRRSVEANSQAVTDLFVSYAIRFDAECRDNWQAARRYAKEKAQQLTEVSLEASYLAEYAFAHLDSHRWDKRAKTAVRAIGDHVGQLANTIISEMADQCRRGYLGPKQTRVGCERLLMMHKCLRGKCRLLHYIVVRHRDNPELRV